MLKNKIKNMSLEEKVGQLFWILIKEPHIDKFEKKIEPGGIMFRPGNSKKIKECIDYANHNFKIKPFISSNMENGPSGFCQDFPKIANFRQLGVNNNLCDSYYWGLYSGNLARGIGANMTFSPISDINKNPYNPMCATRSMGEIKEIIINNCMEILNGYYKSGILGCIKHFPGDGDSNLDQHLSIGINNLSEDEWWNSYGYIYKKLIETAKVEVIMVGHIALPLFNLDKSSRDIFEPASTSKTIIEKILIEKLNYQGLIITDSTLMAGYTTLNTRKEALIKSLNAGIDMILFTRNFEEDFETVLLAIKNKELSIELVDKKLEKIFQLKDKIFNLQKEKASVEIKSELEKARELEKKITENSIEVLRLEKGILPLKKQGKILLNYLGKTKNNSRESYEYFKNKLIEQGYSIVERDYKNNKNLEEEDIELSIKNLKEKYDYVIYLLNYQIMSNIQNIRHEYNASNGVDAPWFINEIPTFFISLSNPYHIEDLPRIKNYINVNTDSKLGIDNVCKILTGDNQI